MLYYRNNKTGDVYRVEGIVTNATNSAMSMRMVLYKNEYNGAQFVREYFEFKEKFTRLPTSLGEDI
jgi:hypothetical protein